MYRTVSLFMCLHTGIIIIIITTIIIITEEEEEEEKDKNAAHVLLYWRVADGLIHRDYNGCMSAEIRDWSMGRLTSPRGQQVHEVRRDWHLVNCPAWHVTCYFDLRVAQREKDTTCLPPQAVDTWWTRGLSALSSWWHLWRGLTPRCLLWPEIPSVRSGLKTSFTFGSRPCSADEAI